MKKRAVAHLTEEVDQFEWNSKSLDSFVIGRLVGLDRDRVLVEVTPDVSEKPIAARSLAAFDQDDLGSELVVLLPRSERPEPLVLGAIRSRVQRTHPPAIQVSVEADGERVELRAEKELVLRVGKASITLTRAGKILLRGEYLLSRSSGVNRIKGGSVQIN